MKYAISNLCLNISLCPSFKVNNAFAIGAYDTTLLPSARTSSCPSREEA